MLTKKLIGTRMADIDAIRAELLEKKQELIQRAEKCEQDLQRRSKPLEKDFAEQATERENDEVLEALVQASREELKQINIALSRMDEGHYSECSECGEDIPEQRLAAVPYTTLCVGCAERKQ